MRGAAPQSRPQHQGPTSHEVGMRKNLTGISARLAACSKRGPYLILPFHSRCISILRTSMNNRREQVGWYFYDWANSAFYTTVVTVFLGPYLTGIAKAAAESLGAGNRFVYPLGIKVDSGSFFPYVIALSVGLQVVFLPILGAIADYSHRKKQMLALFAYIGAFATMGLYFLQGTNYLLGGGLFVLANLSYGASIVFYNSFLPDLASAEDRDRVSSVGWAIGYLGGGLL